MRRSTRPSRLTHLATLAAVLVITSPTAAERLIVRSYTVIDGLTGDGVSCLVTDRDGFLWLCTGNGISRFDGSRFVAFSTAEGLPDPAVNHFLQTRSGVRWVATNGGGVARLESGIPDQAGRVFTSFAVGNSPRSMRVNLLFETRDGTLLAGTDGGLFRARSADVSPRFELVPLELPDFADRGLQIWSIAEDAAGRTWIGTSAGLVLLWRLQPVAHFAIAPAQGADHVWSILPDVGGRLWLGHDAGLFVWIPPLAEGRLLRTHSGALFERAASCVATTQRAALPESVGAACLWVPGGAAPRPSHVQSMMQTPDGAVWMASRAGLLVFDGTHFRSFGEAHGLPASGLRRIAVDRGGDLWTASTTAAHRIQRRGFTYFTRDDGLTAPILRKIQRGPDGHLYAVSSTSAILRFDGDHWTAAQPKLPPLAGSAGRSLYGAALLDRSGAWWVGTGGGLVRFHAVARLEDLASAEPAAHYTTAHGLAGDDIWHLYEDADGDIWIATRVPGPEPLTRWERASGRFHRYGAGAGLPPERAVRAFAEDRSGALWASFWDGGLARFDGRHFRYFPPGIDVPAGFLFQVIVDHRGWLWVGGRQVLVCRDPTAPSPQFETFRTAEGLTVAAVSLAEDPQGWIYAGTSTGLVRFRPEDGRLQQLGFGSPFTGLSVPFQRDDDGTLWLARDGGVLRYEPRDAADAGAPPVWIGAVRVAGVPRAVPAMGARHVAPWRLAAGQRQIEIAYFGLAFGPDEALRYQIRLDGADEVWSSPTSHLSVLYAGLGPGRYRFQVRAVSASGAASPEPATLAFTIPPPLWRRGWFLIAVATAVAALLGAMHSVRVRRLLELERVRTRIAADLHDELGASLARVSLLSEATRRRVRDSPEAAEAMLGEIGDTSRELVSAAGDIAFSIDPERGRLDSLLARLRRFADELLAGTATGWSFTVQGETSGVTLSSDQRRHLLAILKEALHNAVRHGRPRHVTLTVAVRSSVLEAELIDDGTGFDPDVASTDPELPAGHGLRNLRRRAGELGGRLEIHSRPGAGTCVTLRMPLRPEHRMSMQ